MSATLVISLLFSLIGLLLVISALEHYRQKLAYQRHQLMLKLSSIVMEDEQLLANEYQLPISRTVNLLLLERSLKALNQLKEMLPQSARVLNRLEQIEHQLEQVRQSSTPPGELQIPSTDLQSAAMIKTVKKLRQVLQEGKTSGAVPYKQYLSEDGNLNLYILKLFVEYKVKQAIAAESEGQIGTARQFYEKAMKNLNDPAANQEYAQARLAEIQARLKSLSERLKERNDETTLDEEQWQEKEELDWVFDETKKKW